MCGVYSVCISSFSLHAVPTQYICPLLLYKCGRKLEIIQRVQYVVTSKGQIKIRAQSLSFALCGVLSYVSWSPFTLRSFYYYLDL